MRRYIANKLISLARLLDPPNPEFMNFMIDRMTEAIIKGQSVIKVEVVDDYRIPMKATKGNQMDIKS